jgi:O-antigen ligase
MLATVLAGAVIFYYRADIIDYVEKVDAVSRSADTEDHMKSVMNIETDASNLERINRWQCALRMFEDRPFAGFGPGTYQFIYGKYQVSSERTRISTDSGDRGNAHSEYLTYLSETGIPGFIIFNILLLVSINTAIRIFRKSRRKEVRWLGLAILMGFFTYFFHGLFNSFMDTDKASVLVYGTFAALVALDVNFRGSGEEGQRGRGEEGKRCFKVPKFRVSGFEHRISSFEHRISYVVWV